MCGAVLQIEFNPIERNQIESSCITGLAEQTGTAGAFCLRAASGAFRPAPLASGAFFTGQFNFAPEQVERRAGLVSRESF